MIDQKAHISANGSNIKYKKKLFNNSIFLITAFKELRCFMKLLKMFTNKYTNMTEKNRHQHKYFSIINMCLFMFTGENSSGIT